MSTSGSLLTPFQSAEIAGVSIDTINKYEEIGLLSRVEHDGSAYYREQDVRSLFFTKRSSSAANSSGSSNSENQLLTTASEPNSNLDSNQEVKAPESLAAKIEVSGSIRKRESSVSDDPLDPPPLTLTEILSAPTTSPAGLVRSTIPSSDPDEKESDQRKLNESRAATYGYSTSENSQESVPSSEQTTGSLQVGNSEQISNAASGAEVSLAQEVAESSEVNGQTGVTSGQSIQDNYQRVSDARVDAAILSAENKALRDQVELLTGERDWLRKRVEQLETRSEREQMLLLSENETVRRLVDRSTRPRFSLPFRIPWFEDRNS